MAGISNTRMKPLLALFTILILAGCSNQYRDADAELSAAELLSMLNEIGSVQGTSGSSSLSQALAMKDDPNASIYFADGPGPLGTPASIVSLVSFDFLGTAGRDLWWGALQEVRVFFFDSPTVNGRKNGLILALKRHSSNAFEYYGFTGYSALGDEDYEAVMLSNGQEKLVLRSFDVEDGDLAPVIQLQVYEIDAYGNENFIGKFSTLVGYAP